MITEIIKEKIKMNASSPSEIQEKATEAQWKKTAETRNCTDPECSGTLARVDIWMHDGVILEKYTHKGGSDHGCECEQTENGRTGFINPDELLVEHFRGRSKGRGCLQGEI